jgi:transcriptional regulator with XRE-family HTH domain/uncharacterized protein YuzE
MKYIYDRETDSLAIILAEGHRYRDSEEIADGVVIDYDTAGHPIAVEFSDRASRYVDTEGLASGREIRIEHPNLPEREVLSGDALRDMRLQLGMTQEQLGLALTVGKNTVARWEREELRIEHPGMLKLALERLSPAKFTETGRSFTQLDAKPMKKISQTLAAPGRKVSRQSSKPTMKRTRSGRSR